MTIETLLLAFALCVDAFLAAFSYGAGRIQIPFYSAAVIAGMGTTVLGIALWAAALAQPLLPPGLAKWAGVSLLLFIGLWNLFQNSIKGFLKRLGGGTQFSFHWGGVGFVLDVYMDETLADADLSQVLTAREALYLAAALSLDSLVSGFGARAGPAASGNFAVLYIFPPPGGCWGRVRLGQEAGPPPGAKHFLAGGRHADFAGFAAAGVSGRNALQVKENTPVWR